MNAGKTAMTLTLTARDAIGVSHDTSLTDRANIVLHTTSGVHLLDGSAETTHGVVTLRGRVASQPQRATAGLAVAAIDGVLGVRNLLEVDPALEVATPSARTAAEPADSVIKENVEAALHVEGGRALEGLKVTDVDHGVVHMSGKGVTITNRLRAVELAWNAVETAAANDGAQGEGWPVRTKDRKH